MLLSWINVVVDKVCDVLWYLTFYPAPEADIRPQGSSNTSTSNKNPPAAPPPPLIPIATPASPLFALIIGIDNYKHGGNGIGNLGGCVADADDMKTFLNETMGVPSSRIQNLRNKQATRGQIMGHIRGLARNSLIKFGDPILIYYAGHGGEASPPTGWASGGQDKIQMLLPHDFDPRTNKNEGSQGILDATFSVLLSNLARAKGDNITVILDCCHSGSGTRTDKFTPTLLVRGVELPDDYAILPTVDEDLLSDESRASAVGKGFEVAGMASHVLLAACKAKQKAHESHKRGHFTSALLPLLRMDGVDKVTYEDIIARLPDLPSQNPQCEGVNRSRILFNGKVPSRERVFYRIESAGRSSGFTLSAGEAHGVTDGAQFDVYVDKRLSSQKLGALVASKAGSSTTDMKFTEPGVTFALSGPAWALQTRVGKGTDIRISLPLDVRLLPVFKLVQEEMEKERADKRGVQLVEEYEQADLKVAVVDDHAIFNVMDNKCLIFGHTVMPFRVPLEESAIYPVLASAADFYWHLRRTSNLKGKLASKVSLECTKLAQSGRLKEITNEPLMVPDGHNLNIGGVINVVADDLTDYGYKITNKFDHPLFVSVFYFDTSDLSIAPYYQPIGVAKAGEVDPPIPVGGSLTIGYGSGGERPINYYLRDNQKVDVGFLKLFLSTEYVDMRNVKQDSPFDVGRASHEKPQRLNSMLWDTMLVTVVQRID